MSGTRTRIEVVAGILIDQAGRILFAQRPMGKAYEGYWEFPGGKIEPGESGEAALIRELHEELGITLADPEPWYCVEVAYPHARVHLHCFIGRWWQGEPVGREGQAVRWQDLDALTCTPLLPTMGPLLAALRPTK